MAIEFFTIPDKKVVQIVIDGDVVAAEMEQMRERCTELIEETGFTDFVIDMRNLRSLERGNTLAIMDLGNSYSKHGITVWSNTAILMPKAEQVREQVEFLHTIEINRGRGVINYVESVDEGLSWFQEMAERT